MESSNRQKSCEDRIDEHLNERLEQFLTELESWGVLKRAGHLKAEGRPISTTDLNTLQSEVRALIQDRAAECVFSVEKLITYKICLSWGGPADYFELDWSTESRAWATGRYLFQDWFDSASRSLNSAQVEELANIFGIDPEAD
jgi:hypothetical protein